MRLVAVGDVFVDVVCAAAPAPGERAHADVVLRAGGSAVNAALCATGLGASATVVGRVGADGAGELVAAALAERGITPVLARDADVRTGVAVALHAGGSPAVVADRGANARFSRDDVPDPLEGDVLLVSGFALFQPESTAAARAALDRFTGEWSAVDLASPGLASRGDRQLLEGVRVVFATAAEARAMTGAGPEEALRELAGRFPVACVKLGAEGALAAAGGAVERRAAPIVERRRPFGAGDAFAAALLLALAGGDRLGDALERACAAGAEAS
ncbi:MAG TPA: PfkB family carbohydrate kinase [Gaiellaceae bacterium]|nr:PfkB family carbohydrate kinase [Gaiellaceae bacterium]